MPRLTGQHDEEPEPQLRKQKSSKFLLGREFTIIEQHSLKYGDRLVAMNNSNNRLYTISAYNKSHLQEGALEFLKK